MNMYIIDSLFQNCHLFSYFTFPGFQNMFPAMYLKFLYLYSPGTQKSKCSKPNSLSPFPKHAYFIFLLQISIQTFTLETSEWPKIPPNLSPHTENQLKRSSSFHSLNCSIVYFFYISTAILLLLILTFALSSYSYRCPRPLYLIHFVAS